VTSSKDYYPSVDADAASDAWEFAKYVDKWRPRERRRTSMPGVMAHLEDEETQRLIQVKGLDPNPRHRFESIYPVRQPPKYWQ
jgi:hypothetical protein